MGAVKASPSEVMLAVGEGDVDVNTTENRLGADSGHVFSEEVLQLVNAERRKTGAPALCLNGQLTRAAAVHSADMRKNGFFSHTGSDGSSVGVRVSREGYSWCCGREHRKGST